MLGVCGGRNKTGQYLKEMPQVPAKDASEGGPATTTMMAGPRPTYANICRQAPRHGSATAASTQSARNIALVLSVQIESYTSVRALSR